MKVFTKLLSTLLLLCLTNIVSASEVKIPIELTGTKSGVTVTPIDPVTLQPLETAPEKIYAAKFTASAELLNVIQVLDMPTEDAVNQGCDRIIIEFGEPAGDAWRFHSYGGQFDGIEELGGKTSHTLMLQGTTPINDFTIFNWVGSSNVSIIIKAAYFYKEDDANKPILTLKGTVGDEVTLTFGVWETEDTYSVDFGDGELQTAVVGINNAGPVKEDGTTGGATKFTGTVAGDGIIKVYGKNDIWYLITTNGVMPTSFDQPKLMNVVQMTIGGANVESVTLPAYEKMTQFSFNNATVNSVDVSKVAGLTNLKMDYTTLSTIDVSKNTELKSISLMGKNNAPGQFTSIDLSKNTKLESVYLNFNQLTEVKLASDSMVTVNVQNNKLETLDLSNVKIIRDIYASDNLLTSIDLSMLTGKSSTKPTVNVYNNKLTELTIPVAVKTLQAQNNKLKKVQIADITSQVKLENNELTLETLPALFAGISTKPNKYTYAPQAALEVEETASELDLSAQLTATGILEAAATTTYSFLTVKGDTLVEGTDYEVTEPGKFKFLKDQEEKVYAVMASEAFPLFADAKAFKTTEFAVIEYVEPEDPDNVVKLEHTASSYCGDDPEVYTSDVDAETEHVNNAAFNSKWQGAAYAEFSFSKLPANATITNAVLTFKGIGESRNPRNADVMLVNAGETLDYAAMAAGNAKVNLDATKIQSVTFPKGTSEVFTVDVTEQLGALVAGGQKYAIFKVTGNPGGGDIAGKASADAPTLVITFAPGAPEIANASFEADGAKAVSNGPMELTGWTFEGVGTQFNNTEIRPANSESTTSQFGTSAPNDGDYSLFFRQGWNGNGNIITLTSDALNEIPSGDYLLSVAYKQHYSYDNTTSDNTFVALSLVNGETTLATGRAASAAGAQGSSADATYFNDTEWSTLEVPFSLDENLAAGAKIVIALNAGGQRRSDFFIDNVKLEKVAGIEVSLKELEKAIAEAQAKADTYTVGDGLFMYAASEIDPLTAAIATAQAAYTAAESKEAVAAATETLNAFVAAFAPVATLPDADKAYTFELRLGGETPLYMALAEGGITIAEEATPLKFIAVEGSADQYNLSNEEGTLFVGLAGGDAWTMSTVADNKAAWTFTALPDGAYRINNLVTAGRFVGTNAADKEAGKPCYADKKTDNGNVDWIIAVSEAGPEVNPDEPELVAPEGWTMAIANGNLAGDDVSSYVSKEQSTGETVPSTIVAGAGKNGSRGIVVNSSDNPTEAWDTQFWIVLNEKLQSGAKLHVQFDYKANKAAKATTQAHGAPGAYQHWAAIGDVNFTEDWQTFSTEIEVTADMATGNGGDGLLSIAFNLAEEKTATEYCFDNFGVWYQLPKPVEKWADLIVNGDMEGESMECFYVTEEGVGGPFVAVATEGIGKDGSKAVKVQSGNAAANNWDTQFFVRLPYELPAGTKFKFSFDYKSDVAGDADTQCHNEPGQYIHYTCAGSPSFTTGWQSYVFEGTVPSQCDGSDNNGGYKNAFQTIAFNLAKNKVATAFIFDNVKFEVEESIVSSLTKDPAVDPKPYPVGIKTVNASKEDGLYYDLQGRRVAKPGRGLYIVNGTKVMVK